MIAGVPSHEFPDDLDGVDMSAVWTGNITVQYRRMPTAVGDGGVAGTTTGFEAQQPLIWYTGRNGFVAVLSDQFKYIERHGIRWLFDVDADPMESRNLWRESGYTATGNHLQAIADEYLDQIE